MAKPIQSVESRQEEAFEMIETAIEDLSTLSRAFEMVTQVCEELSAPRIELGEEYLPERLLN